MYSIVSVENLKLYEPPMIMDPKESSEAPSMDDFAPKYLDKFLEDITLYRIIKTS